MKISYKMPRKKDDTELNEKTKQFCHEYVVDWNATRSYKKIYSPSNDNVAAVSAHRLLNKDKVKAYIELIKNDYEKLCGISKTKQLRELAKLAYSSVSHLHNTWIELKDFESLTEEQKECIESIDVKTEQKFSLDLESSIETKYVKIKLYSKLSAIEQINKMMGYNEPDKLEHSGAIRTPDFSKFTYDQLKELAGTNQDGSKEGAS